MNFLYIIRYNNISRPVHDPPPRRILLKIWRSQTPQSPRIDAPGGGLLADEFDGELDILSLGLHVGPIYYSHRDIELDYESDIDEFGPKLVVRVCKYLG